MKRFLALTLFAAASLFGQVPTGTALQQGNVHLYITQLTAAPVFVIPGATPETDYHRYFVVQVWDTTDLPVQAFRVTVNFTTTGRKASTAQILGRTFTQDAIAGGVPSWGVFSLGSDAVINSVLVEELVPTASESF